MGTDGPLRGEYPANARSSSASRRPEAAIDPARPGPKGPHFQETGLEGPEAEPFEEGPVPGLPAEERRLAERACRGDRGALGELYRRHVPMVHGIVISLAGPFGADDLVQDVFLKAIARLDTVKDPAAFPGWLAAIARNVARDSLRARRPEEDHDELELPVEAAPRAEAKEALLAVLSLPEAYRETLVLRLVEGMTGPEIALRTGLTPGSVRVNLCRGFKLLKDKLGEGGAA